MGVEPVSQTWGSLEYSAMGKNRQIGGNHIVNDKRRMLSRLTSSDVTNFFSFFKNILHLTLPIVPNKYLRCRLREIVGLNPLLMLTEI
jgi:hypothetical protein